MDEGFAEFAGYAAHLLGHALAIAGCVAVVYAALWCCLGG